MVNFKCRDFFYLTKEKYEKPSKWRKLKEVFNLEDKQVSETFVTPLRVAINEPYLRSFQYIEVLNSILYTNELLCKIGYVSNPNCSFCQQTIETISHIVFDYSFAISFWKDVYEKISNKLRVLRGEDGSTKLYTFRKIEIVDMPLQRNKTMFEPLRKNFDK